MKLNYFQRQRIIYGEAVGAEFIGSGHHASAYFFFDNHKKVLKITREHDSATIKEYCKKVNKLVHKCNIPKVHDYVPLFDDLWEDKIAVIEDYIDGDCLEPCSPFFGGMKKYDILAGLDVRHYKKLFEDMYRLVNAGLGLDLSKEQNFIVNDKGFWIIDTHYDNENVYYLTYSISAAICESYNILMRFGINCDREPWLSQASVGSDVELAKFRYQKIISDKFFEGLEQADIPRGFKVIGVDTIEKSEFYKKFQEDLVTHEDIELKVDAVEYDELYEGSLDPQSKVQIDCLP